MGNLSKYARHCTAIVGPYYANSEDKSFHLLSICKKSTIGILKASNVSARHPCQEPKHGNQHPIAKTDAHAQVRRPVHVMQCKSVFVNS